MDEAIVEAAVEAYVVDDADSSASEDAQASC